jgi:hypothetical protein
MARARMSNPLLSGDSSTSIYDGGDESLLPSSLIDVGSTLCVVGRLFRMFEFVQHQPISFPVLLQGKVFKTGRGGDGGPARGPNNAIDGIVRCRQMDRGLDTNSPFVALGEKRRCDREGTTHCFVTLF